MPPNTHSGVSGTQRQRKLTLDNSLARSKGAQHELAQERASASTTNHRSIPDHFPNGTTDCDDVGNLAHDVDRAMPSADNVTKRSRNTTRLCPYHEHQISWPSRHLTGLDPMSQFLMEDASEQSSVCYNPRTGKLSITKPCTCGENLLVDISKDQNEEDMSNNWNQESTEASGRNEME
ncbi:hypothetical protein K402DRAFT_449977 [Aulographum hederae CBS 113979]|uniref:Uncharacterized protein n=1 Tax=Aulographum hederae CBS 113979 TaxID=1176131 RepID=A0A6G1HFI2_9PEZI|nr:hypothetical protein K402DRAFT_449977 [Aulographum hederae CBS 113979]